MLRPAVLTTALATLILAGCGGDSGGGASLDDALGYLPLDAPLVVSVGTDLDGEQVQAIGAVIDRFPFGDQVRQSLREGIEEGEADFEEDVRPLLGNEFVIGLTDPRSITDGSDGQTPFVGAIQTSSGDDLRDLVEGQGAEESGEESGATIYEDDDGGSLAIEGDTLIVADSPEQLTGALAQRDADDRLTEDDFDEGTDSLADDALLRVFGDLASLLRSDPDTQQARKVGWVGALRSFGLTASFSDDAIDLDFTLETDPEGLGEEDLPIATGEESPPVIAAEGEIGAGVRDPGQIVEFAQRAGQAIDPGGFGQFQTARQTLEARSDVDLDEDVLTQLEQGLSMSIGLDGEFAVRAALADGEAFDETLAKLGEVLPDLAEDAAGEPLGYAPPRGDEDFYALATPDGESIVYGVVDDAFVLSNDARRAATVADQPAETVDDAEGAVVVNADAQRIATRALAMFGGQLGLGGALGGAVIAGPLGDVTGSLSAETDGLSGSFTLTFD